MPSAKKNETAEVAVAEPESPQGETIAEATELLVANNEADWMADAGAGHEDADKDSYAIPFLRVLQTNSPQVDEGDGQFVPGAKPGMIFNTVTGALYDGRETGVELYPAGYQRRFLRWAPRGAEGGGSMRGEYLPEEADAMITSGEVRELDGRLYFAPEGEVPDPKRHDRLVDTRSHYFVMRTPNGDTTQALLPLSSTQIKKSKQLMSMLRSATVPVKGRMINPPTWVNRVRMTTQPESNDQGKWYGVRFTAEGFNFDQGLYDIAKAFHDAVTAGTVNVNYDAAGEEVSGETQSGGF